MLLWRIRAIINDAAASVPVINNVAALGKFPITLLDAVAILTRQGCGRQHLKNVIELLDVQIALLFSPMLLRKNGNGVQISFGLPG